MPSSKGSPRTSPAGHVDDGSDRAMQGPYGEANSSLQRRARDGGTLTTRAAAQPGTRHVPERWHP